MKKQQFWLLASGQRVTDSHPSHVHEGVTPELLAQALSQISVSQGEAKVKRTIDFGRMIGASNCVETSGTDQIIFAQRVNRGGLSRFAKDRKPEPATQVTLSLRAQPDGSYQIGTAYIGPSGATEPWAAVLSQQSERLDRAVSFWTNHALCWGHEPVIPGTETTEAERFFSPPRP